ncbi:MAG TPA: ABC transporter ATP-binding protein [Aggregatilineales bacterium]|nr:ABC transporter ATP-binding protein [Anaerolineales bacterium]HRE46858.1 ABC transporter ATP-binding protein [Aggregatilineales bacterium]
MQPTRAITKRILPGSLTGIQTWVRLMGYLRPYRRWVVVTAIALTASTILAILIPRLLRDVIDIGVTQGESSFMVAAGALVIGLGIFRGVSGFLFRFFGERLSHYIAYDIRNEVYDKVQRLPFAYHDSAQTGTLITVAISDVDEVQRYFGFGLIDGINTLLLFAGVTVMMLTTNLWLTLIALTPLIPLAILSVRFARQVDPRWRGIMERVQKLGNHLQESVIGAQVVRAFAREDYEIGKFAYQNVELFNQQLGLTRTWAYFLPLSAFIVTCSVAAVLFVGALLERAGMAGVTVGTVVAFNAYVLLLGQPLRFFGFVIILTTQGVTSSRRIFDILDAAEDIKDVPNAVPLPPIKGHVRFENLSFRYPDAPDYTLRGITIEAQPGQVIALLGKTGSGKSSLINLISRFYEATQGRVLIDGRDVKTVTLESLRRQIGVVLQESLLFSASIRENIAYGRPDVSEEAIIAAAEAANAHGFITEFPDGYDTLIGERGVTLSGGQRQRIAIARALLIDPRILILDDSMSSVDTKTEFLIQEALERLMKGRTTFVIAQRLTTVQNADTILVLDHGEIAERGTHADLLARDGLYADIYRLQLEDQERLRRELMVTGGLLEAKP